jgi:hypothetical protein
VRPPTAHAPIGSLYVSAADSVRFRAAPGEMLDTAETIGHKRAEVYAGAGPVINRRKN